MTHPPQQGLKFRSDINGLRAFAVIAVVLFHFELLGLHGGFIGVDVFFVISGFLMTQIITQRLQRNEFTLLGFYLDRAFRIFPALLVLSAAVLVYALVIVSPEELKWVGKHIATSLAFLSNFTYWSEGGYFDTNVDQKWLLHTWSLSVEWQFYLIYPLLLSCLFRAFGAKTLNAVIVALFASSFALSLALSSAYPTSAFYLLPTRAWEMALGALVFIFPIQLGPQASRRFAWVGLGMMLFAACFFSEALVWPGWLAAVPAIGAALVIAGRPPAMPVLSHRWTQHLGKISYSVYLWHWPLVVALMRSEWRTSLIAKVILVGVAIGLGWLSYRFVETPALRFRAIHARRGVAMAFVGTYAGIAVVASLAYVLNGFPSRASPD